jgi:hypothetical protein
VPSITQVGVNIVLYEGVFEPAFVLLTIVIVLIGT